MLSDFTAMFPSDGQLPAIWDCPNFFPATTQSPKPIVSSTGSYDVGMNSAKQSPGSDELENALYSVDQEISSHEPDQTLSPDHQRHGSRKRTRVTAGSVIDERKLRRMESNRESARRSRIRKQKHLENLTNQLNRLRMENQILSNRLKFILLHCHQVRTDNEQLRLEHVQLSQRLAEIRQVLTAGLMQEQFSSSAWPCSNNNAFVASEQIPSLITY